MGGPLGRRDTTAVVPGAGALVGCGCGVLSELDDKVRSSLVGLLLLGLKSRVGKVVFKVDRLSGTGGARASDRTGRMEETVIGHHA